MVSEETKIRHPLLFSSILRVDHSLNYLKIIYYTNNFSGRLSTLTDLSQILLYPPLK